MVRFTKRYKYSRMNGGKKKRRKTQKNKRKKHRKGGMTIGNQKPYSTRNPPNVGHKVRVDGKPNYTVVTSMNRAAEVCPPGKVDTSNGFPVCTVGPETIRFGAPITQENPQGLLDSHSQRMSKHGFIGQHLPFLKKKGGRKKRRKSKRKKSKRKRRKTKRRMKGGSGKGLLASPACSGFNCDMPTNVGEIYTHYPNNTNPFLPDPMSLNSNLSGKALISPKPMAGKKGGRRKRRGRKNMKGGFFFDDWGLGDGLLAYYKGTNAALNTKHLYAGNKPEVSATPSDQPELLKKPVAGRTTPNIPNDYENASNTAASYTIN